MSDAFAFDQPFEQAVNYFLNKQGNLMTRAAFDKLSWDQKAKAFTAAYITKADELQRVYDAVLKALEKGTTLADFKKGAADILNQPWHRETVFHTNVLSAYGRGHWEQAQAAKALRPYARYSAVLDGRTRPRHAALHGLIFPLDHPFWQLYWPPWDYNCRCAALTLSPGEIAAQGLEVNSELPNIPAGQSDFISPSRGGEWTPDLGKYHAGLRQVALEDLAAEYQAFPDLAPLLKRQVKQEDLEALETVLWARGQGGRSGYRDWVGQVAERGQALGEMFPAGNLPGRVLDFLENQGIKPRLALIAIDDQAVLHMQRDLKQAAGASLSADEVGAIPEKFATGEWYWDREDPALLMTWIRTGDAWIKVVIRLDQKVGKGIANRVVTAGVVREKNIVKDQRYEKL